MSQLSAPRQQLRVGRPGLSQACFSAPTAAGLVDTRPLSAVSVAVTVAKTQGKLTGRERERSRSAAVTLNDPRDIDINI